MTEDDWWKCSDPWPMLRFLYGRASDRKLRLLACASWKPLAIGSPPAEERIRRAEGIADGLIQPEILTPFMVLESSARKAAEEALGIGWGDSRVFARLAPVKARLLRDLFGPLPFRPVTLDPSWLTWNDATVPKIAQVIYDDRRFSDLPILADALEDAGCSDPDLLGHCRRPGEHVRGCWVVDSLLGKA